MKRNVLVIGGGPAGITTAIRLSEQGYRVTVLEQTCTWGGRLTHIDRAFQADSTPVVLLGCHEATFALLKTLGTASRAPFTSELSFEFVTAGRSPIRFHRPLVPAPWGTLLSLLVFPALPFRDRWRFLTWIERTWEKEPALPADLDNHTAEAWLRSIGQSERARTQAWTPLSRFLLGDDLKTVSASLFLGILIRCFMSSRRHSMLAMPHDGLTGLLMDPALEALRKSGAILRPNTPAGQIQSNAQGVTGVRLHDGTTLVADWYVAAVPHGALSPLLPERAVTRFSYFQQLPQLIDGAMLMVHLWINSGPTLPRLMLLADRPYHRIMLRPDREDSRRLLASLVATGRPALLDQSNKELVDLAMINLGTACPELRTATLLHYDIVRERQAFLSVRPRTTAIRPLQQSPFSNFFLAGAWTDTGLPSTLESAIHSGDLCAKAIIAKAARDGAPGS